MQQTITGLQNDKIKNLVKLRQRRQRDKQRLMLIDGARALNLALTNDFAVDVVYFAEESIMKRSNVLHRAFMKRVALQPVSAEVFAKIGYGNNPDGILGLSYQPSFSLSSLPQPENPLYIVVEGLEKPGNLGAILRSADAAGVTGLICCNNQTDIYNPNVIRASRGAFFTVPLAQADAAETIAWLRERRVKILAATPNARTLYSTIDMRRPVAIALGAEHSGLTEAWFAHTLLKIPMAGQVDSLNVAQSASILMFEAIRQRG